MIKKNQKNMKECDKRKSHKRSKLHVIYISSNNVRHPVTKTFTTTAQQYGDDTKNKFITLASMFSSGSKSVLTGWTKIT